MVCGVRVSGWWWWLTHSLSAITHHALSVAAAGGCRKGTDLSRSLRCRRSVLLSCCQLVSLRRCRCGVVSFSEHLLLAGGCLGLAWGLLGACLGLAWGLLGACLGLACLSVSWFACLCVRLFVCLLPVCLFCCVLSGCLVARSFVRTTCGLLRNATSGSVQRCCSCAV